MRDIIGIYPPIEDFQLPRKDIIGWDFDEEQLGQ